MSTFQLVAGTVVITLSTAALLLFRRVRNGWRDSSVPKQMRRAMVFKNIIPNKDVSVAGFSEAIKVVEIPTPVPGPGQVLVRMESTPINPSDLGNLTGKYNEENRGSLPAPLGLEGSGTVVAAGPGLMALRVTGKRVACVSNAGGAWSEYNIVDAKQCAPLPDDVNFEEGCSVFVNPLTVMAMISIAQDSKLNTILHTAAASSLGKMLIRAGKRNNIRILCLVRREEQARELLDMGVDKEDVFSTHEADWATRLTARCVTTKCKLGFDAISGSISGKLMECMPYGATLHVYGALSAEAVSGVTPKSLIEKDQTLTGLYLGTVFRKKGLLWALRTISSVLSLLKTDLRTDVAKRFTLDQVPEAVHFYVNNMSAGKVVIQPQAK